MNVTNEMIEALARCIDPGIWADDLPIPTRGDTISFHARRQQSSVLAKQYLEATLPMIRNMAIEEAAAYIESCGDHDDKAEAQAIRAMKVEVN